MRINTDHLRRLGRGFTLVELLVAITIASALTAIALPTLKDSMRQTTLSRSASLVKGAFINARTQAIRTGRPYGLVIERRRSDIGEGNPANLNYFSANYATRLYYVQSPMEYRGDVDSAVAYPIMHTTSPTPPTNSPLYPIQPKFFIPRSSSGLLYALASGVNSAASRLIRPGVRFSVNGSGYVFVLETAQTEVSDNIAALAPVLASGTDGTLLTFNCLTVAADNNMVAGNWRGPSSEWEFPMALSLTQPYEFKFQVNPIRAPLAPVNLVGRTVVDLSISGPSTNPIAFNSQVIVDSSPGTQIPNVQSDRELNDVVVMFAADGRLNGVYTDVRDVQSGLIENFVLTRFDPSTTVSFNIGYVDGILENIDDAARYPQTVGGTDYQVTTNDPPLANPQPPLALVPTKVPNFANPDCAWVSVQPLSGAISLGTVATQPPLGVLTTYYGLGTNPTARQVVGARIHQSRRLNSGGAVQ
ncbi:prepilin-type N-terminal cleavage/methylation domain-containing protein [Stieleria sp. ICT_E10.1]|uniref:pilus assembly FimT family protein n=1 Tax=Stieleria sedimenti TaxID=2976331 RepID=UPI0021801EAF|nr:prepilin-type N-terminal cleavage/methylation domain-containing protein [Stieleria sedimenti]MCS7468367.1 prepilin-type N-terminal cleavage/methylation domain-containing protein [Stieleria sedimenti]